MTDDERPRPQYGEYATPEEVAALRGPDAEPLPVAAPRPPAGRPIPGPPPAGQVRPGTWDNVLTMVLLGVGVVFVIQNCIGYAQLPATLSQSLDAIGYSDVHIPQSAQVWGWVLVVVNIGLLFGALVISLRRLRHGRLAFWVPIVAAVIASVVTTIIVGGVLSTTDFLTVLQNRG
jgi:hypothetical protein